MQCGPLSWLSWHVDSSLWSKMTQNSLCLLDLLSSPSLPSALSGVWRKHPFILPISLTLSGDRGNFGGCKVGFCESELPSRSLLVGSGTNGTSEWVTKICGRRVEGDCGCAAFLVVRIYEEFAQIVYSSLGFEWLWLDLGFWKLIKAADNRYSMSPFL